jgi:hypothetical protein
MIPCTIRAEIQTCFLDLFAEPLARGEMRFTERWPLHTAIARRADFSQLVERSPHSI